MRILFIGPIVNAIGDIKSFGAMWSFQLSRALEAKGIEIVRRADLYPGEARSVDHIVAVSRYFSKNPDAGIAAMDGCKGIVAQVFDRPQPSAQCHLTLSLRRPMPRQAPKSFYIGWAADRDLFKPAQSDQTLRILIDHPLYGNRPDDSESIIGDALEFKRSFPIGDAWEGVRIRQIVDNGFIDVSPGTFQKTFTRAHVSVLEMAAEYGAAHIFIPTHAESVGLAVLEAAVSGALPVVRSDYLHHDFISTVPKVLYGSDGIPWSAVMQRIDPERVRAIASYNTWERVAGRVLEALSKGRNYWNAA